MFETLSEDVDIRTSDILAFLRDIVVGSMGIMMQTLFKLAIIGMARFLFFSAINLLPFPILPSGFARLDSTSEQDDSDLSGFGFGQGSPPRFGSGPIIDDAVPQKILSFQVSGLDRDQDQVAIDWAGSVLERLSWNSNTEEG